MLSWGPHVSGRKVRNVIRERREEAGITQRTVAENMDWSLSKVTRVENGDVRISTNDLRMLLQLYGASDESIEELVAISRDARAETPWQPFAAIHSDTFLEYLEFEQAASHLRKFHGSYIPGMLQTRDYCLAVMSSRSRHCGTSEAELRWTARERRQRRLREDHGPFVTFVLDEAAVRRLVGGAAVMRDQVRRLIEVSTCQKVRLQIVPFENGSYDGMRGPFTLLDFDDPDLGSLLYVEPPVGEMHLIDHPDDIGHYEQRFDHITERALDVDDTRKLLHKIQDELAGHS